MFNVLTLPSFPATSPFPSTFLLLVSYVFVSPPSLHSFTYRLQEENVNVTANLLLNVYGMNPVNFTIDLCSVLSGALCPLPTYNFTGADSLSLPDSLGVKDKIPGIAFKIPDLEGFAQLTLTEIGTGDVKACVQATLSNGWSMHQPAVEWVTAIFALAAFVSAALHSVFPDSLVPFRFLDLFYLYQAIASSAFLNINYPSLYRAFTLNFAWATGLVSTSSSSSLQSSIDNMRHLTGGRLADSTSSSAVGFVNRKLSPYNQHTNLAVSSLTLIRRGASELGNILTAFSNTNLRVTQLARPEFSNIRTNLAMQPAVQGEVQTVTADSSNVLEAGIPIYANSIHIGTANAFMTSFIVCLIVLVIAFGLLACGYVIAVAIRRTRARKGKEAGFDYFSFVQAWLLRLVSAPLRIIRGRSTNVGPAVMIGPVIFTSAVNFRVLSMDAQGLLAFHTPLRHHFPWTSRTPHISTLPYHQFRAEFPKPARALFSFTTDLSHLTRATVCTVSSRTLLRLPHTSHRTFPKGHFHLVRES